MVSTRKLIEGFGATTNTGIVTSNGTFSYQNTTTPHGEGYALRCNPTTTGTGSISLVGLQSGGAPSSNFDLNDLYFSFKFLGAGRPASGNEVLFRVVDSTLAVKMGLRQDSSGNLLVYDSTTVSPQATSALALPTTDWRVLQGHVSIGTSIGWEVRIYDLLGILIETLSGTANSLATQSTRIQVGKVANISGSGVDFYYKDILIDSAGFPNPLTRVKRVNPNANGSHTGWTSGTYADVDEAPTHDTDGTYILASSPGVQSVRFPTMAASGIRGTVNNIKSTVFIRDEGGVSSARTNIENNGSVNQSGAQDPGATYVSRSIITDVDPHTSVAWTEAGLDTVEVAVNAVTTTSPLRWTMAFISVEYIPNAAAAPEVTLGNPEITVASDTPGTPSNVISLFQDTVVVEPNLDNVTATITIADPTKCDITSTLPSGWSLGLPGVYSRTSTTDTQLTLDLQTFQITGLVNGDTTATLAVNDGVTGTTSRVVTIHVITSDKTIEVPDEGTFDWGELDGGIRYKKTFRFRNNGDADGEILTVGTVGSGWSIDPSDDPTGETLSPGEETTVTVFAKFNSDGAKTGKLQITSDGTDPLFEINFTANVSNTPSSPGHSVIGSVVRSPVRSPVR